MDFPPQVMKDQVRSLALRREDSPAGAWLDAPARPMPVLQAFRDFLEAERRRARRKFAILASFFCVVLAVVVIGGLVMVRIYARKIDGDVGALRSALDRSRAETAAVRADADTRIAALRNEAEASRKALTNTLNSALKGTRNSIDEVRTGMSTTIAGQSADLKDLMSVLTLLQEQNVSLRDQIGELGKRIEEQYGGVGPTVARSRDLVPQPQAEVMPKSDPVGEISLSVRPAGSDQSLTFRVMPPE
jgi:hypothetical protein